VTIKAPPVDFDAATAVASVNVTLLENSGDLSQLADAARLLSSLAAYVLNSTSTGATVDAELQSAVQGPATELVMSASRMVNRDSPVEMHQVGLLFSRENLLAHVSPWPSLLGIC
jgi:hypothetical protein